VNNSIALLVILAKGSQPKLAERRGKNLVMATKGKFFIGFRITQGSNEQNINQEQ